jgi:putative methyltransferase (TIGR04325 family)
VWGELSLYRSRHLALLLGRVPVLRYLLERRYERLFASRPPFNLYRGVFRTFDEARRSAPDRLRVGYDRTEAGRMYDARLNRVFPADYPMLFWLARLLRPGVSIFDLGGHVGIAYYAYAKYLEYPDSLSWKVCDVPAVVVAGQALARERGANTVSFTDQVEDASGADIFLAAGSLQYIEEPLIEMLKRLQDKPAHLLINKVPLVERDAVVTLQGIGVGFCPYHLFHRQTFIAQLEQLGYEVVDAWENADQACQVPFTLYAVDAYSGFYLRHKDEAVRHSNPPALAGSVRAASQSPGLR